MNNNFGGQTMSTPSQGQLINVVLVPDIDDIDWYPINPGGLSTIFKYGDNELSLIRTA